MNTSNRRIINSRRQYYEIYANKGAILKLPTCICINFIISDITNRINDKQVFNEGFRLRLTKTSAKIITKIVKNKCKFISANVSCGLEIYDRS